MPTLPKNIVARGSRSATWHNGVLRNAPGPLKKAVCIVRAEVNNDIKRGTVYENPVDFLHDAPRRVIGERNTNAVVVPIKAKG